MMKNRHHNRPFDAERKNKMKHALPTRNKIHNVDAVLELTIQNNSSAKIVGWLNSKFKQISSETLTRTVIVL
jgi:hypothetical protein